MLPLYMGLNFICRDTPVFQSVLAYTFAYLTLYEVDLNYIHRK